MNKIGDRIRTATDQLDNVVTRLDEMLFHLHQKVKERGRIVEEQERLAEDVELTNDARRVLELIGELKREEAKQKLERITTKALRLVFNRKDLEFRLTFDMKRNVPVVIASLVSKFGTEDMETSIKDGHGGGFRDVIAFVLQVLVLLWYRPKQEPFIISDEGFKHTSRAFLPNCASLVKQLHDKTGIQFVLITHKDEFLDIADKAYEFKNKKGLTRAEEYKNEV